MATETIQHPFRIGSTQARLATGRVTGTTYPINSLGQATVNTQDLPQFLAEGWLPVGDGGALNNGNTTINFGVFPGSAFATTTLSGLDINDPNAVIDAWIAPIATADHSREEHIADPPMVSAYADGAGNVIVVAVPAPIRCSPIPPDPMPYGAWSVGWAVAP